jgi:hypothetical protein
MDIDDIPMVRLTWLDAQDSDGSWTELKDILNHEPATCQEVGWLIHQDEYKVIVMRSRIISTSPDGLSEVLDEGGAYIAIPSGWVVKVEELLPVVTH